MQTIKHVLIFDYDPKLVNYSGTLRGQRVLRVPFPFTSSLPLNAVRRVLSDAMSESGSHGDETRNVGYQWRKWWSGGELAKLVSSSHADYCAQMLSANTALIAQLRKERYDLAVRQKREKIKCHLQPCITALRLIQLSEVHRPCLFGLLHGVGVPLLVATSPSAHDFTASSRFGVPALVPASWTTNVYAPLPSDGMLYRGLTVLATLRELCVEKWVRQPLFDAAIQSGFGWNGAEDYTPLLLENVMQRKVAALFVNSHPLLEIPRLASQQIIHIGGIVEEPLRAPLSRDVTTILARASNNAGAVLFSLGGAADPRQLPRRVKMAFLDAFAHFSPQYEFIWKYPSRAPPTEEPDADLFSNHTADCTSNRLKSKRTCNVHRLEWVPQQALLRHPAMRGFITHCGLNSVGEAARAGVPLVGMPLAWDHHYAAAFVEHARIGVRLRPNELHNQWAIVAALKTLLGGRNADVQGNTPGENIDSLAGQLHAMSSLKPPSSEFITGIRRVISTSSSLTTPLMNNRKSELAIGLAVYYSLDVVAMIAATVLLIAVLIII